MARPAELMMPWPCHIQPSYEELGDWPHGLLAIGTLGSHIQQGADPSKEGGDQRDYRGACSDEPNDKYGNAVLVHSKRRDVDKKSLSFVLKKMFVCTSGFSLSPALSLRDPIPPESPMEKILRTILQKKIHPQSSNPRLSSKKSLESSHTAKIGSGDGKADDGSKWTLFWKYKSVVVVLLRPDKIQG
ncbi:hypothetical protein V6N12_056886 [Hibiscus sabdariffa]|uniref:Uncharacterized protein n=1 Tax=Hibiscus sabdariffa TaxID=183260 RepID=A0ABR2DCC9_9ROSI